jgi:hypothetical protein
MKVENKKYIYKDPIGNYYQTNNAENFGCDTANVLSSFDEMNNYLIEVKDLANEYNKLCLNHEKLAEDLLTENDQLKAANEALEFQLRQTLIS